MHTVQVNLNSVEKVRAFVNSVNTFDSEFDLVSGRFVIDAKSGLDTCQISVHCCKGKY